MKTSLKSTVVLVALLFSTNLGAQELHENLTEFKHLLGWFEVKVMLPDGQGGWRESGEGKAEFVANLGGRFIEENIVSTFGNGTLTMNNIIGVDPRDKELRLFAMDKEFGAMDVYTGMADGKSMVFTNLNSDKRFTSGDGQSLAFRLSFSYVSDEEHSLLVEYTNDEGKSWNPYARHQYKRMK